MLHERNLQHLTQQEHARQQREKDRVLRRIMNQSTRIAGVAFRQAYQHTLESRDSERA
jgi:hypothetical protein